MFAAFVSTSPPLATLEMTLPPLLKPSSVREISFAPGLMVMPLGPYFVVLVPSVTVVPSPLIVDTALPFLNCALVKSFNSLANCICNLPSFALTPIFFSDNFVASAPPTISSFSFNVLSITVFPLSPAKCKPSFIVATVSFTGLPLASFVS